MLQECDHCGEKFHNDGWKHFDRCSDCRDAVNRCIACGNETTNPEMYGETHCDDCLCP